MRLRLSRYASIWDVQNRRIGSENSHVNDVIFGQRLNLSQRQYHVRLSYPLLKNHQASFPSPQERHSSTVQSKGYLKMISTMDPYSHDAPSVLEEVSGGSWTPLFQNNCTFPPEIFRQVLLNLIRNPNINSNHLFRADISLDYPFADLPPSQPEIPPQIAHFKDYDLKTVMVRTLIPRNMLVDKPLDQTCLLYEQTSDSGEVRSLVVYVPHMSTPAESPFYHPAVRGIGFLHVFDPESKEGSVSIHYSFFDSEPRNVKLERTAQHLLAVLHKHGKGNANGYVKRVNHDAVLPQAPVQNTYARLKAKYAKSLIENWAEQTDPAKHVFEDLGIAAFLIELWREMYKGIDFPGFVDIGCGNGLLVRILTEEGYSGWGFDARKRKSWSTYSAVAQDNLKELVLIPSILQDAPSSTISDSKDAKPDQSSETQPSGPGVHNGIFAKGAFIISNHADELTPWTPILANISESPFMMIPCCSHSLDGSRCRVPIPKGKTVSTSAFASLVLWVSKIADECGWVVEKEMLRIPSTRNTALIGRRRIVPFQDVDVKEVVKDHGGAEGWKENALKLVKGGTRGH